MQKRSFNTIRLCAILLLIAWGPAAAATHKTDALEQKVTKLTALQVKIIDKIDQAMEIRTLLQQRLNELREEIKAEQKHSGIHYRQKAMKNLRVNYNLKLIQQLHAYLNKLGERITYFQIGNERLKFILLQIKDDVAIIKTLKDMQIDHLIGRVNAFLDEFIPETEKQFFDVIDIRPTPADRVWKEIITPTRLN